MVKCVSEFRAENRKGFTAYNAIAFADVEAERMSDAKTLSATINQLTTGFGVAIGALALRLHPLDAASGLPATATGAFNVTFFLLGAIAWVSVIESVQLAPHAGAGVSAPTRRRVHANADHLPERPSRQHWRHELDADGRKDNDLETEADVASRPPSGIAGDSTTEGQR